MVYSKSSHEYEKMFKEEESIEILNIFGLSNKTGIRLDVFPFLLLLLYLVFQYELRVLQWD